MICPPLRRDPLQKDTILNPRAIVEVLSPSTADYDRGTKFNHYKQIPELNHYVLVAQDRMEVDHYRRQGNRDWLLHTANDPADRVILDDLGVNIMLAQMYEGVELQPSPEWRPGVAPARWGSAATPDGGQA